jgi:hypothetical protein
MGGADPSRIGGGDLADIQKMEQELMFKKLLTANRPEILGNTGLLGIYGPDSNIVECAADVLRLLVHNIPPVGE